MKRAEALVLVLALALVLAADIALAQSASPFGVARPDAAGGAPSSGLAAWILSQQSGFYRALSTAIRAFRTDSMAAVSLIGLSLAYGVFHAAGPGHGKAVISSYLLASDETLKKGIALSFAAALVQALSAIGLVGVLALVFNATAAQMDGVAFELERASYAFIALVGLWLVWRKGGALWGVLARHLGWPGASLAHRHDPACDHQIAPDPARLAGPLDWRAALGVILSIGVRPCTGAIIVLVFALAQGVFVIGVASAFAMALGTAVTVSVIAAIAVMAKGLAVRLAAPGSLAATLALGALELVAALFVLSLGAGLLIGLRAGGPG